jgi:hypothetical protein
MIRNQLAESGNINGHPVKNYKSDSKTLDLTAWFIFKDYTCILLFHSVRQGNWAQRTASPNPKPRQNTQTQMYKKNIYTFLNLFLVYR